MKLVLLSALAHTAVLAGDTSKNMLVDRGGEHRTKYLRKLKKDLSVSLHGEIVDGNEAFAPTGEDSKNWSGPRRGTTIGVARWTMRFTIPNPVV